MIPRDSPSCYDSAMRNLVVLFIHLIATLARLLGPGGVRSLVAESLLLKHQGPDLESLPATIAQSAIVGPHPRRLAGALGASNSSAPFRNCTEALDTASPSLRNIARDLRESRIRACFARPRLV